MEALQKLRADLAKEREHYDDQSFRRHDPEAAAYAKGRADSLGRVIKRLDKIAPEDEGEIRWMPVKDFSKSRYTGKEVSP